MKPGDIFRTKHLRRPVVLLKLRGDDGCTVAQKIHDDWDIFDGYRLSDLVLVEKLPGDIVGCRFDHSRTDDAFVLEERHTSDKARDDILFIAVRLRENFVVEMFSGDYRCNVIAEPKEKETMTWKRGDQVMINSHDGTSFRPAIVLDPYEYTDDSMSMFSTYFVAEVDLSVAPRGANRWKVREWKGKNLAARTTHAHVDVVKEKVNITGVGPYYVALERLGDGFWYIAYLYTPSDGPARWMFCSAFEDTKEDPPKEDPPKEKETMKVGDKIIVSSTSSTFHGCYGYIRDRSHHGAPRNIPASFLLVHININGEDVWLSPDEVEIVEEEKKEEEKKEEEKKEKKKEKDTRTANEEPLVFGDGNTKVSVYSDYVELRDVFHWPDMPDRLKNRKFHDNFEGMEISFRTDSVKLKKMYFENCCDE